MSIKTIIFSLSILSVISATGCDGSTKTATVSTSATTTTVDKSRYNSGVSTTKKSYSANKSDGVVGDNNNDNDVDEDDWESEWKSYLDDKLDDDNGYDYHDAGGNGYNDEDVNWDGGGKGDKSKSWDQAVDDWNAANGYW